MFGVLVEVPRAAATRWRFAEGARKRVTDESGELPGGRRDEMLWSTPDGYYQAT
jgi:hypothetical protein